jgi:LuxR family maltose regulon positive regulatory protein
MSCSTVTSAVVAEVDRRRFLAQLADRPAVVVVSAPAGSGKSIAARQWASHCGVGHAMVRLAGHLDDPAALMRALVDALDPFGPPAPGNQAWMTGMEPAFSATALPALARFVRTRSQPYLLVLDDVHLLGSQPAQQVLATVCDATPDGSTTALLTRGLTPAWLAQLRTTGRLTEITQAELAFDLEEVTQLFRGLDVAAAPSVVADVLDHTEGWAVGVYLSALGMRSGNSDHPRITKGSDRAVADYLRTQVLSTLSDIQRDFLVRSSILDELHGPLCDAVLERTDSAGILADLHREVQLVIRVHAEQPSYRCHHLLAEELAAELHTARAPDVRGLHRRACLWFDENADPEAAIRHAVASGDTDLMARVIWPAVPRCVASGDLDRLRGWLAGISERQIAGDRWLTMAAAWASLQQGDAAALRRWAGLAQGHAGPDWREAASHDPYSATFAVLEGLVGGGGLDDTRDLCGRALGGLPPTDSFRAAAAFNKGIAAALRGDSAAGLASLHEAEELARALDVPVIEANAKSWMGLAALNAGDRQRGIRLVSQAADLTRRHQLDRLATAALSMTAQALMLAMVGDKSAAFAALATARRLTVLAGGVSPWFAVSGRLIQARTSALLGDGATARLLIDEAAEHMTPDLQASSVAEGLADTEALLTRMSGPAGTTVVLTSTELRVLQFLPSHLTLQQIGEHLFVSQATVKTHVLSIYRKFGVSSRDEAVEHARLLGLVDAPLLS